MRLDAHTIARITREAGFVGDAATVATAVALATSGGFIHYRHQVGIPGAGDYRGLWGVDIDRFPELADADFANPLTAAKVAHELCEHQRGWQWSPAYRSGAYTGFLAHAGTAGTQVLKGQAMHGYSALPGAQLAIAHTLDTVRRAYADAGHRLTERVQ